MTIPVPPTVVTPTEAARVLAAGGLVGFPTETVYGLGADASSPVAVARIFAAKGRPADHPVIVHVAGADALARWASRVPPAAARLVEALWPGPLTVVVPRAAGVTDAVTGGLATVGVRAPAHPLAQALLDAFADDHGGIGIAAPSANRFGRVSPTTADAVRAELGAAVDVVLDGGPCRVGVESTIVDCSGERPVVLRLGGVTLDDLAAILGERPTVSTRLGGAPGTLASHYAPTARVLLVAADEAVTVATAEVAAGRRVGLLGPTIVVAAAPIAVTGLDAGATAATFAHLLYAHLRSADAAGLDVVVAVAPGGDDLAAAVTDRLRRAAHS